MRALSAGVKASLCSRCAAEKWTRRVIRTLGIVAPPQERKGQSPTGDRPRAGTRRKGFLKPVFYSVVASQRLTAFPSRGVASAAAVNPGSKKCWLKNLAFRRVLQVKNIRRTIFRVNKYDESHRLL